MKKLILQFVALLMLLGCSPHSMSTKNDITILRIKGSDSMLLLVQRLADQYMATHSNSTVSISVEGGGSGSGIEALINGSTDICATSRPLSTEEVRRLAERFQSIGVSVLCAKDALSIIIHPSNPIRNLTLQQIKDIFTGKIENWKEIGGRDGLITIYGRESNSGTFLYFEDHVLLGEKYSNRTTVVPGARALMNSIALDSVGIGYSTFVYTDHVKSLSVNGVSLTAENVRNGSYPISRYLYFYTVHPPDGEIKKFINWVVGREGQTVAKINGYIPLYDIE